MALEHTRRAYFSVTSNLPLAAVEAHFGLAGDGRCWSIGAARPPPARGAYPFSRWSLESGIARGDPLETHLSALWRRLAGLRDRVIALPDAMTGRVVCVAHFTSHRDPLAISSGHFATCAFYGVSLDCDFTFDDEFGCEEAERPYWTW